MEHRSRYAAPDDGARRVRPGAPVGAGPHNAPEPGFDLTAAMAASKRRTRRRAMAVVAVLVVVLVAAGAGIAWWLGAQEGAGSRAYYDANARAGQAPWKSQEEMQAELDRVVEEGMFDIAIAATIEFPSPGEEGLALIENVPGNRYDMRVTVTLDDTGEELYRSGLIAPGSYIESIGLSRELAPGTHEATAVFEAVDAETHAAVGKAAAQVKLVVKGG